MKKRALTLIEIMIVIFLITLITGAIGYNMKGSMDRGREFRTKQGIEQVHDLLMLSLQDHKPEEILDDPLKCIKDSGLAKNPEKLMLDGWNDKFDVKYDSKKKDFLVTSKHLK